MRPSIRGQALAGAAALLGGLGCGDGQDATAPTMCTGPVTVTVGDGTQPRLQWEPRCAVSSIVLLEAGSEALSVPVWSVLAPTGIGPPVRVGGRPGGTSVFGAGATLVVGESYTAILSTMDQRDSRGLGSVAFTVQP